MKKTYITISLMPIFLAFGTVSSQVPGNQLDRLLETAALNNPGLKAEFSIYLASLEKVPQAGALQDPQASLGFFLSPMELMGGNQAASIEIMQMFPWFGTNKSARDESLMMAKAKYEAFNATRADLFFRVSSAWYELLKWDHEIALVEENIRMLGSVEEIALARFSSPQEGGAATGMSAGEPMEKDAAMSMNKGAGAMEGMTGNGTGRPEGKMQEPAMQGAMDRGNGGLQEVLRIRMELLDMENRLETIRENRKTAQVRLNALLNRDLSTEIIISDSLELRKLPAGRIEIADSILSSNPMLAMVGNETQSFLLMGEKAKKMGLPMFGVGLNYMVIGPREGNSSMMNGKDMVMPMVSVTIPVYRKKYNAMKKEADMMHEASTLRELEMKNELMVQYHELLADLDEAARRIRLAGDQEELAETTMELLLTGLSDNGTNLEELLRMQVRLLEYRFNNVEATVDHNIAVARAEMLMNSLQY